MKKIICLIVSAVVMAAAACAVFADDGSGTYSHVYGEGEYIEASIPSGEYVLFAEDGKIGKYTLKTRISGEKDVTTTFSYNHILNVQESMYFQLEDCYAVPSDEVKSLDLTKNGMFRCGVDLPTGDYTFKRDEDSQFALVYFYDSNGNIKRIADFWDEGTESSKTVTLGVNTNIYKLNCDIYKGGTLLYDFSVDSYMDESADTEYNYSNVSAQLKNAVSADIKLLYDYFYPITINSSSKFGIKYYNSVKDRWNGYAKTADDRKYIEVITGALDNMYNYCSSIRNDGYQNAIGYVYYTELLEKKRIKKSAAKELFETVNDCLSGLRYASSFGELGVKAQVMNDYVNVL